MLRAAAVTHCPQLDSLKDTEADAVLAPSAPVKPVPPCELALHGLDSFLSSSVE